MLTPVTTVVMLYMPPLFFQVIKIWLTYKHLPVFFGFGYNTIFTTYYICYNKTIYMQGVSVTAFLNI